LVRGPGDANSVSYGRAPQARDWPLSCFLRGMTKMFISLDGYADETVSSELEFDTMRSKAAMPAYSCKLYRTRLEQGAASEHAVRVKPARSIRTQNS